MSTPTSTKTWVINEKPTDAVTDQTFKLVEKPLRQLGDNEVLLRVRWLSNDPAQRTWIDASAVKDRAYGPFPEVGDAMPSLIMAEVIETNSTKFEKGALVTGFGSWSEYLVLPDTGLMHARKVEGHSESAALSVLGMTATTAWNGLKYVGDIKATDTLVVSGAAGATGSAVVQLAKIAFGVKRVVGIAGGQKKCDWVKTLGADECLDYRSETFEEDLVKATDGYVDVYFDNVGGKILNLMFKRMARFSRIVACGAISGYNSTEVVDLSNIFEVISMRIRMQGFIVSDFPQGFPESADAIKKAIEEGKWKTEGGEHKVPSTFEQIPETWQLLFSGGNQGKLVTELKQ